MVTNGMAKPLIVQKDLERELWSVYDSLTGVDDAVKKAELQLKALDLVAKIRVAGQKVKPGEDTGDIDPAMASARAQVNGVRK